MGWKTLSGNRVFYCAYLILVSVFLISSAVFSDEITGEDKHKFITMLDMLSVKNIKLDLNIKIPITDNPAGPDCDLWATAVYHTGNAEGTSSIKRPTILVATAYRREFMMIAYLLPLLPHDYNVIAVDMRGTGSGEGVWGSMDLIEQYDIAYLVDEWIPSQPWSDGKVGMFGGSYMAILQFLTSALVEMEYNGASGQMEPKHLKAMVPLSSYSDVYQEIAFHGGNFELEFMAVWMGITDFETILPPLQYLGGNEKTGINAADTQAADDIWLEHMSQLDVPIRWILDESNMVKNSWYETKSPLIYWPEKPESGWDFMTDYPSITGNETIPANVPVFNTTGWFDIFTRGTLNNYQYGLSNQKPEDKALIIGPWYHIDAAFTCPGIHGLGVDNTGYGFNQDLAARWFDWKIKGKDDPFMVEFPVVIYVMGEDKWRAEKDWPLPESRVEEKTYYLSKRKQDTIRRDWFSYFNRANNFSLVEEMGELDLYSKFLWWRYEKKAPVLFHDIRFLHGIMSKSAQRWFGFSPLTMDENQCKMVLGIEDTEEKRFWEDERMDEFGVLTFTTKPLEEDIEIIGPLSLTFWAKTKFTQPGTQEAIDQFLDQLDEVLKLEEDSKSIIEMADKKDVQWVVELNDVYPDGRAQNVTSGWLSAWHRPYDPANPEQLDPDYVPFDPFYCYPNKNPNPIEEEVIYPYVVEMWATDNMFKKGHRIRISISASDIPHLFPVVRPSKNTIVIDEDHMAKLDIKVTNTKEEGETWKWIDENISDYLINHRN
ncbi:MAG: CocE/NonD family hydrolase [Proteobacteria bacterium]|nr:CocE/NonD family hydrolase [Pseudomonadota bacterium]